MVDTTSPLLGLLLMGTGGDTNAWGSNLNTQVFTPIENAIAGITSLSVTGGSHSLSSSEALSAVIILSGTLTSDQTIVVPGTTKTWKISNQTTGNFYIIVKAGAGTGVNVPQGSTKNVICTGTTTVIREDKERVGEFFYHGGTTAPAGSFVCNGATALRASAIDLYTAIGTTWGVGDGFTTFTLPNAQDTNRFLRSSGGSLSVGTYQSSQNLAHTHTATASAITGSTDSQGNHFHSASISDPGHSHSYSTLNNTVHQDGTQAPDVYTQFGTQTTGVSFTGVRVTSANGLDTTGTNGAHTHTVTGTAAGQAINSSGGTEARPEALVGLLCIRY